MADTLTTALRLLANNIDCEDGVAIAVVLQAADEIDRLRERLEELRSAAEQADAEYRAEIAQLSLTDAERAAIQWAADAARDRASVWTTGDQLGLGCGSIVAAHGDTLRGLLERTKYPANGCIQQPRTEGYAMADGVNEGSAAMLGSLDAIKGVDAGPEAAERLFLGKSKHDGSPDPTAHLPNTVHAGCRSRESDAGTGDTKEQRWISVTERLPDEGVAVLVWSDEGDCQEHVIAWRECVARTINHSVRASCGAYDIAQEVGHQVYCYWDHGDTVSVIEAIRKSRK